MLISESWLKSWLDTDLSINDISEILTMSGIEVDNIDTVAPAFSNVVLGKVKQVKQHPNADRLKICSVDVGTILEIVCGAPNVTENMYVACAKNGATLPGNIKIKNTKLRGIESFGMLCSEKELGISKDCIGIMDLKHVSFPKVGMNLRDILHLDEKILTLKITPNRGDCLSVRGVARDLSASLNCSLKNPIIDFEKQIIIKKLVPKPNVVINDKDLCGRFSARIVHNVDSKVKTPDWIVERLNHAGQKSISVLVDISNYVMLELGRPSHIFDLDKIQLASNKSLDVRWALNSEEIKLLNGEKIICSPFFGVIADNAGPIALAGIMGGERTAVCEQTQNILIETAFWRPDAIRGRAQNLRFLTDASHRFERGVDFESTVDDLEIISGMIQSICGGDFGEVTDTISSLPKIPKIYFRKSKCEKVIGMKVTISQIKQIFDNLFFKYETDLRKPDENFFVTPPSYRFDVNIEEDLIEEVIRIIGYDSIPTRLPVSDLQPKVSPEQVVDFLQIKDKLVFQDFYEVINYGFIDSKLTDLFKFKNQTSKNILKVINPISTNMSVMRNSLIPGLINVLRDNLNNQQKRVRIFELGRIFHANKNVNAGENSVHGVEQPYHISALIHGSTYEEQWGLEEKNVDFFDLKKILLNLSECLSLKFKKTDSEVSFLHPGRSALIHTDNEELESHKVFSSLGNGVIGYIGEIHPRICTFFDFVTPPIVFEVNAQNFLYREFPKYKKTPKVPIVRRDLAFVVDNKIEVQKISDEILSRKSKMKHGKLLLKLEMFDLYNGKGISETEKSLAFAVYMQDTEKTLEENIVESLVKEIVKIVENKFTAKLRS